MTDLYDIDALLGRAEDTVRRLVALGADCAEAYVSAGTAVGVQVEKDVVTYTTGDSEGGMGLRVVKDGRLGFAYTSDPARLEEAGGRALDLTRLAPRTGYVLPSGATPTCPSRASTTPPWSRSSPGRPCRSRWSTYNKKKKSTRASLLVRGGSSSATARSPSPTRRASP